MAGPTNRSSFGQKLFDFLSERSDEEAFEDEEPRKVSPHLAKLRRSLLWHVNHSLSHRQKEVLKAYLAGHTERAIADALGVKQQVVHIYKSRAIKKLQKVLRA